MHAFSFAAFIYKSFEKYFLQFILSVIFRILLIVKSIYKILDCFPDLIYKLFSIYTHPFFLDRLDISNF